MLPTTTHKATIAQSLETIARRDAWGARHRAAWLQPARGFERAIVGLVTALAEYADEQHATFERRVCDDHYLGSAWAKAVQGAQELLTGETGRLDRGTVDQLLQDMLELEGHTPTRGN